MTRTVTVGLDGSPESRAAAEWAAREALLRGLPLKVLHVRVPLPEPMAQAPLLGPETGQDWTQGVPGEAADGLRLRHPGIEVVTDQVTGDPARALAEAADGSELLALGSRGFGGVGGFMVGSVSLSVITHTARPVVLVRAGQLAQARYALTSSGTTAPRASLLTDAGALTGLDALLTGVPAEVRTAFSRTVLGPLLDGRPPVAALLTTLETFLACDGSWARTAQALHLHVNTVHYRMQRIERLTGRDLSRLGDRLDLWAALLCR
ncbi:universal stress protein [Streptomyces sp. NPDC004561]